MKNLKRYNFTYGYGKWGDMEENETGEYVQYESVEKLIQKAEATLQLSGAKLFAEDHQEDMYVAIDAMVDKLDRQIIKHKEKTGNHR